MNKTGDLNIPRPVIQSNHNNPVSVKITQVGPVVGSNVIVSRMDGSTNVVSKPPRISTSASPIPIAGPLAPNHMNGNNSSNNYYFNNNTINTKPSHSQTQPRSVGNNNFYHSTANNVTKFTNMTVANAGSKNPLKPTHYTVPTSTSITNNQIQSQGNSGGNISNTNSIVNLSTHPNANLTAPNTSGIAPPKTTLKASDLIHILPNLFNTLKRRNSNSGSSGGNGIALANTSASSSGKGTINNSSSNSNSYFNVNSSATNTLAAAVAAATSHSGKPLTQSTAAVLVAEQLLNVAASGPFSDDSSSSPPPPPHQHQHATNYHKRIKLHDPSALQCEICGKSYKHRNCLSKHMWEHHDSWEHTKKVCQTKHQQVQLLEAAQVLAEIISGVRATRVFMSEDDSGGEEEEKFIEDGIREMIIVPTGTQVVKNEDENISIGGDGLK